MLSMIILQKHTFSDNWGIGKLEFVKVGWTMKCFGAFEMICIYIQTYYIINIHSLIEYIIFSIEKLM